MNSFSNFPKLLLIVYLFIPSINTKWRLYKSNDINKENSYNCLYLFWSEDASEFAAPRELIPYCIRPDNINDLNQTWINVSYKNIEKSYKFSELREQNITTKDLYKWFAPIDLIEQYDIYLEYNDKQFSTIYFNKCKKLYFGNVCEYTFDINSVFPDIVDEIYVVKFDTTDESMDSIISLIKNGTCYKHLKCHYIMEKLCLDWREICDGKMDCLEGEDEENCFQLEINQCNKDNEFRCRNGLCIPNEFLNDDIIDCLDGTDEDDGIYMIECGPKFLQPSIICEEHFCGLFQFSCADSNCFRDSLFLDQAVKTDYCANGRHVQWKGFQLTQISTNYTDTCWQSILNLTRFSAQPPIWENLSNLSIECPPIVIFPSYPIIYGHVRFIYFLNKTDWLTNHLPNLICFNQNWCPLFEINLSIDNLNCTYTENFFPNKTFQNLNMMIMSIEDIFKGCTHPNNQVCLMIIDSWK